MLDIASLPEPPFRLSPNPGGTLLPNQVIGRDPLIRELWTVLDTRSLLLSAPRRLGKSSICRRMIAYPPSAWTTHARDLEGGRRPEELVSWLFEDVRTLLSPWRRAATRTERLLKLFGGKVEVAGVRVEVVQTHWVELLDALLDDLDESARLQGLRVALFWDEFPLFIGDLARNGAAKDAMVLLDRLRAARARNAHTRMVLNGSIGVDEVIGTLRQAGYANDPFNDMGKQRVPVLPAEGAVALAQALIRGAELPAADLDSLAPSLATLSEGHPFVLQHLANGLRHAGRATPEAAADVLDQLLDAENDPLELRHWLVRLETDGNGGAAALARTLLDRVAAAGSAPTSALIEGLEAEAARGMLTRLRQEGYLARTGEELRFSFAFLRTWWRRERGL